MRSVCRAWATALSLATAFSLGTPLARAAGDPPPAAEPPDEQPAASPPAPELVVRGFGDVNYHWRDGTPELDSFELGQVDLFVTSRLSDDLSVLGELVWQPRGGDTFTAHVERLLLTYHPSDALRLSVGRYHTAIGYYNTAFHHGTWFQTATDRPFLFAFAKDGGILPIHNVGVSAGGRLPLEGVGLHYVAEVGDAQPFHTASGEVDPAGGDDGLAVNLGLYSRPPSVPGLQVGVSAYYDRRDHLNANARGAGRTGELIAAVYAVYESGSVELLNEALAIRHRPPGAPSTQSWGFYLQAAPKRGWWRPYARYQYVRADPEDHPLGGLGRRYGPSLGLRRELGAFAAVKAQYDHTTVKGQGSQNGFTVQAAFTF
jgi:hypothetical protein